MDTTVETVSRPLSEPQLARLLTPFVYRYDDRRTDQNRYYGVLEATAAALAAVYGPALGSERELEDTMASVLAALKLPAVGDADVVVTEMLANRWAAQLGYRPPVGSAPLAMPEPTLPGIDS